MNYHINEYFIHVVHDLALHFKHLLKTLVKLTVLLFLPISVFLIFSATNQMILLNSPENMSSMTSLGYSFLSFLDLHFMILLGALGITFVVWFFTRNLWKS